MYLYELVPQIGLLLTQHGTQKSKSNFKVNHLHSLTLWAAAPARQLTPAVPLAEASNFPMSSIQLLKIK